MNTMLHLLEAYTNLLRVWDDERLRRQVAGIVRAFAERIVDPATGHLQLFFDERWRPLTDAVSFGHDIETSWLLCEAADLADGDELQSRAKHLALRLAETTLRDGVDADGSLASDGPPGTAHRAGKEWWPQAEAIVGFYNAYQLTGDQRFSEAAIRCWEVVQEQFVDRVHGDWFKHLSPDGRPDPAGYKAGPWDCPYHHGRACLEMLERLDERP